MISVIIPAHNEAAVIGRCLAPLTSGPAAGKLEIVVVANGCTDDTAARAETYPGVHVIDTSVPGKGHALNLGDSHATGFPRFYVDADIELSYDAIRAVGRVLERGDALVAAPRIAIDLAGRPWRVRAYYDIWTRLPYLRHRHVGSGVYAVSEAGRERFDQFPEMIADDLFIRNIFEPEERMTVASHTFTVRPPTTLRGIVQVRTWVLAGNAELIRAMPHLARQTEAPRPLGSIAGSPRLWPGAAIYTGVYAAARAKAAWKVRRGDLKHWERDDSARVEVGS
jgi:glycosyltransferase involved in cell wall biosynthesis